MQESSGISQKRVGGDEHGSVMLLTMFVLTIVGAMGISLIFLSNTEMRMGKVSMNVQQAFYLAEAGVEDGRSSLWIRNGNGEFTDDLWRAAGTNDTIEFDPANLVPIYDADGKLAGLTGYGDDEPLTALTPMGEGFYAAFLTNDPAETTIAKDDGNNQVMITGIGAARDGSFEIVQAIVDLERIFPAYPPATITLLGPDPEFYGAESEPKVYEGHDCGGTGEPNLYVPVVGTIGSSAEAQAEQGIKTNPTYQSGGYSDEETFADLTDENEETVVTSGYGRVSDRWTDCADLHEMVEYVRLVADVVCVDASCVVPAPTPRRIVFVDGDYTVDANDDGAGLLLVTGELRFHGRASWHGLVYVIGQGQFTRYGSGGGTISGATVVADIAGPDDIYGTADDCTGGDGGFDSVIYDERGGGTSDTTYCTRDFTWTDPAKPYAVKMFRQL